MTTQTGLDREISSDSKAVKSRSKNDRALRFYSDVLGLETLHYGMWLDDDELCYKNLKRAQQRYEDFLVDNIPEGVESVLDVGCGTGAMSKRLKASGLDVAGLSPDQNQKANFEENIEAPFHFCRFEDFVPEREYDCIMMSEVSQYVPLDRLFKVAKKTLNNKGYLLVCDYYVLDGVTGIMGKSGHNFNEFRERAAAGGFSIVEEEDVTPKITKSLDIAKFYADKTLLGLDLGTEKIRKKYKLSVKFILWLFRKKIKNILAELELLDSKRFTECKRYQYMLFRLDS